MAFLNFLHPSLISFFLMDHQDWTTVTMKRHVTNPLQSTAGKEQGSRIAKLDAAEVVVKRRCLTAESRQALVAARLAEKKSQRDIDKELAFPANTIRDFEAGAAAPNGAQISALQRRFAAAHLVLRVA